jgi:hypothetical protein
MAFSMIVPGMWSRKVGLPIWVDFMDVTTPINEKKYMEAYSGLYIVKSITHIIHFPSMQYQQAISIMSSSQLIQVSKDQVLTTKNLTNKWKSFKPSSK